MTVASLLVGLPLATLLSLLLPYPLHGQALIAWQSIMPTADAFRGLACSASRPYPYNGASDAIQVNGGFLRSSLDWGNEEWTQKTDDPPFMFTDTSHINTFPAREGHAYFLTYQNSSGLTVETVIGGRDGSSSNSLGTYTSIDAGAWTYQEPVNEPDWTPVGTVSPRASSSLAWNLSYTQVVDDYFDASMVGVVYGWTYFDLNRGWLLDNRIAVVEVQPWTQIGQVSYGPNPPWSTNSSSGGRQGVAMSGFNGTSHHTRGRLALMGGLTATSLTINNDVWVSHSLKHSRYTYYGPAAWSPRWAAQAFDGGRGGLFLYGGYISPLSSSADWSTELWYGQFGVPDPSDPMTPPVWYLIDPQYISGDGGPTSIAGCAVAWWASAYELYLVMIGSHTNSPYVEGSPITRDPDPSSAVYAALVTYDDTATNTPYPMDEGTLVVTTTHGYERIAGNPDYM